MGNREPATESDGPTSEVPVLRAVDVDPRKFSEYVLVPNHPSGKDRVFLGTLGYRPRSEEDARTLVVAYVSQAHEEFARGRYVLGERDRHGQRYAIAIALKGFVVMSGWIVRPDGTLRLATPFTGFAR